MTEPSTKNNQALEILSGKVFEILNDKSIIAPYLVFSPADFFEPENKSQFTLTKDHNSLKMNGFFDEWR